MDIAELQEELRNKSFKREHVEDVGRIYEYIKMNSGCLQSEIEIGAFERPVLAGIPHASRVAQSLFILDRSALVERDEFSRYFVK